MSTITQARAAVVAASLGFGLVANAVAVPVLDQANEVTDDVSFNGGSSSLTWQQGVTAGLSGLMTSFEIFIGDVGDGLMDVFINVGAPWQADANDFDSEITVVAGWNSIDVSGAGITLSAGDEFAIGIHGLGSSFTPSFRGSENNLYAGDLYLSGSLFSISDYDMAFRTFVDTDTPAPAPLGLVVAGLGLIGFVRRRR